jgi:hypothetical protein
LLGSSTTTNSGDDAEADAVEEVEDMAIEEDEPDGAA